MTEATPKEKEYTAALGLLFTVPIIGIFLLSTVGQFDPTIGRHIPPDLLPTYELTIGLLNRTIPNPVYFKKEVLTCLSLLCLVLLGFVGKAKIQPKASVKKADRHLWFGAACFVAVYALDFRTWGVTGLLLYAAAYWGMIILFYRGIMMFNALAYVPQKDIFNEYNEQFPQNETHTASPVGVGFHTQYEYKNNWRKGIIPVVNPMRATLVVGSQGSGKTYAVLVPALRQSIHKGYCGVVYDYKFPDLTRHAYNALVNGVATNLNNWPTDPRRKQPVVPKFAIIDFENLAYSNRANPFNADNMATIDDCAQMAKTLMLNLNKSWIRKEGDFWALSAINLLTCVLWFLRLLERKYPQDPLLKDICNLPHAIELLNKEPKALFRVISQFRELDSYSAMFTIALQNQAGSQIAGQIASTQAVLAQISSPNIYWVMSGDDVNLAVNDPQNPQILCLGNNPVKAGPYGAALSVYTATVMRKVYRYQERPCGLFIDELPSMYLMGLDEFIAQVRSYKVATWLGIQDFEQLTKSYGKEAADVISNTCGNIFAGQVNGMSAERLSKLFGESMQANVDSSLNRGEQHLTYKTTPRKLLPPAKIMTLPQGQFCGKVADDVEHPVKRKLFNAFVHVEKENLTTPLELPKKYPHTNGELEKLVQQNYFRIKENADRIMERLL